MAGLIHPKETNITTSVTKPNNDFRIKKQTPFSMTVNIENSIKSNFFSSPSSKFVTFQED